MLAVQCPRMSNATGMAESSISWPIGSSHYRRAHDCEIKRRKSDATLERRQSRSIPRSP